MPIICTDDELGSLPRAVAANPDAMLSVVKFPVEFAGCSVSVQGKEGNTHV
ncbi:MAG: hypothetical protein LBL92_02425 [Propionibacteriaceae bacterium]|jgi:hypothetical protein|nr:hypothetical protein [Propionibacteriaceae bacterium]